ncbi:MAG: polysaccharide lyase [Cyanobacteria bacterium P01_B01_bin.77]
MFKSALILGMAALISCQSSGSTSDPEPIATPSDAETSAAEITSAARAELSGAEPASSVAAPSWKSDLSQPNWIESWESREEQSWGFDNFEWIPVSEGPFAHILRVHYPASSASPSVSRKTDAPLGGAQFYSDLFLSAQTQLRLSYYVRFAEGFDFVRGGKLPGLFGGAGASGGNIPDGTDGFSTRLMWRENGQGEVYAYLPTSENYGTSIGRGNWQFQPGIWYKLDQEVKLNTPHLANGQIRMWVNDRLVLEQEDVSFRTADSLRIDGIFFSTFFGGGSSSWATPQDTYIDFANFSVTTVH